MAKQLPIVDPSLGTGPAVDPDLAAEKFESLRRDLSERIVEGALVAFSGGLDSAFLLWVANTIVVEGGGAVMALTTTSPSTPARDKEDATAFTEGMDVPHLWRVSQELSNPAYTRNDRNRCYHCKAELFRIAEEIGEEHGLRWILYGYNASDHSDDRPGHRAAIEAGVVAPLSDAGLTKPEIRHLMSEAGLPLAAKPASPCLSSRIMTGLSVTPGRLQDVEALERILREAGVRDLRVRVCATDTGVGFLRVEVPPGEMPRVLDCRLELQKESEYRGYRWVTLDLGGYKTGGGVS